MIATPERRGRRARRRSCAPAPRRSRSAEPQAKPSARRRGSGQRRDRAARPRCGLARAARDPCVSRRLGSARPAPASWVISSSVMPRAAQAANIRSMTACPVSASRLPVGSSASSSRGRLTSARASATRCCSPPGQLARVVAQAVRSRPTSRSSAAAPREGVAARPPAPAAAATFSSAVMVGIRWKDWNRMPIRSRRNSASPSSSSVARSTPSTTTRPPVGRSMPADDRRSGWTCRSPTGPPRSHCCHSSTARSTPRRIATGPAALGQGQMHVRELDHRQRPGSSLAPGIGTHTRREMDRRYRRRKAWTMAAGLLPGGAAPYAPAVGLPRSPCSAIR